MALFRADGAREDPHAERDPRRGRGEGRGDPLIFSHALPGIDTHEGQQILGWWLKNFDASLIVVDSPWAAVDELRLIFVFTPEEFADYDEDRNSP